MWMVISVIQVISHLVSIEAHEVVTAIICSFHTQTPELKRARSWLRSLRLLFEVCLELGSLTQACVLLWLCCTAFIYTAYSEKTKFLLAPNSKKNWPHGISYRGHWTTWWNLSIAFKWLWLPLIFFLTSATVQVDWSH